MNALRWHLNQWLHHFGITGLVGLALLAVALLLQLTQVEPLKNQMATQRARLASQRLAADTPGTGPVAPPAVDPLALLPPMNQASQLIGDLEQLAQASGMELPRGQYSVSALAGTSLRRWQLVLPVEVSYPTLIAFIAAALERQPNLTLDELKLKREHIDTDDLQTELRMSLYVKAAP
ncbi:MAG: GspMb/PilO family protein [Polaromonas sp.]